MQIRKKLAVSYTILAILVFLVAGFTLRASVGYTYRNNLKEQLISQANTINASISQLGNRQFDSPTTRALVAKLDESMNSRINLLGPDGAVLGGRESQVDAASLSDRPELLQAVRGRTASAERSDPVSGKQMLYVAVPYKTGGKLVGITQVSLPMTEANKDIGSFTLTMLAIAIFAAILIVLVTYLLANSFTAPLGDMMEMTERMANDDLEYRLPTERNDEIGELSKSLNMLAVKLKGRIDELRSEKAKADLILDNMAEGILLISGNGEVVLTNPSIEHIFEVNAADLIGNPVIHSIRSFDLDHAIQESAASGKEVVDEIELQTPFRQLRIRIMPITNNTGERQTLAVIRNITRQKQVERLRRDFVANISHELKTPLTGLKLLSETLLRSIDTDPASSRIFIKRLDKELSLLIKMVLELIDLSKLESDQVWAKKEPTDLGELINEVGSNFSQHAANKRLTLTLNIPENIPLIVGDRDQLLTLIRNLVDNAIRYTPGGGGIEVRLSTDDTHIYLTVADNGIGLAKREVPRIFERFYRVDKARSRETGGTGLGLAIVKHVAENHSATVTVDSSLGIGSTFTIRFPLNPEPDEAPIVTEQ